MKISVVIPTYNYAHYLDYAIASVLAQERYPDEIIVVDDGSTDNTKEVVARYQSQVRYVYQKNAGLSAARNKGTAVASGDWVAYLDSDDAWTPAKLLRQEQAILNTPGAVVAYTGCIYLNPDQSLTEAPRAMPPGTIWPLLRARNMLPASSTMAHRKSVLEAGGFNEALRACEDWDLWVRLKPRGPFAAACEPLTIVRQTPQSMSSNVQRMIDNMEAIREGSLLFGLSGFSRWCWTRRIRSVATMHAAMTMRESGLRSAERVYLLKSIWYWPSPGLEAKRYLALLHNLLGPAAYKRISSGAGKLAQTVRRQ
jgi:glycosyltransferase involved in cell wall biosynthesis